jgi:hypothetical protein
MQHLQIPVKGTVIERLEFDLDAISSPVYPPWQLKEGLQAVPTGMSELGRKVAITHPHAHIRQSEFADGHDLVLAVVQFVHLTFLVCQVFNGPQQFALFTAVALTLGTLAIARVVGFPLLLLFFPLRSGLGMVADDECGRDAVHLTHAH